MYILNWRYRCTVAVLVCLLGATSSQGADSEFDQALIDFEKIAILICGKYPANGSSQIVELDAEAEGILDGFLRKLASLGIRGAAEYTSTEYWGLVQDQLGPDWKDNRDCRLRLWDDFKYRVLVGQGFGLLESPSKTFYLPVAEFHMSERISATSGQAERWGRPLIESPGNGGTVEYQFTSEFVGSYRLEIEYAAAEKRPIVITLNDSIIAADALNSTNGDSWNPGIESWEQVDVVSLLEGKNTLRFTSDKAFPYILGIRFTPNI